MHKSKQLNVFQSSSICKTAVHAGVISDERGGFVDVMPVEKKKTYVGSLRNGVQSERWDFLPFVPSSSFPQRVQLPVEVSRCHLDRLVTSQCHCEL